MCNPILITAFKIQYHYSYSICENMTPSSGAHILTSLLWDMPHGEETYFLDNSSWNFILSPFTVDNNFFFDLLCQWWPPLPRKPILYFLALLFWLFHTLFVVPFWHYHWTSGLNFVSKVNLSFTTRWCELRFMTFYHTAPFRGLFLVFFVLRLAVNQ